MLHCVAVCCSVIPCVDTSDPCTRGSSLQVLCDAVFWSVLRCVAACCSALQGVAVCYIFESNANPAFHQSCHTYKHPYLRGDIESAFRSFVTASMTVSTDPNPPNSETQLPRYNFKLNQNLNLNSYREIPRNLSGI